MNSCSLLAKAKTSDLAEERRRQEAELHAAQALAAAETQAKEEAQRHASVLRRRNWILRAALALAVIAAVVAGFLNVRATKAEEQAEARARDAAANSLVANSAAILSGAHGLSDDVLGMQLALAVGSFPSNISGEFALLNALNQARDVIKIIPTDGLSFSVAFSPDGNRLASAHGPYDPDVEHRNLAAHRRFHEGHTADVKSVAFSPDGKLIASSGCGPDDPVVGRRNSPDQSVSQCGATKGLSCLSPSALTAVASSREVQTRRFGCGTWQAARRSANRLRGHTAEVLSVAFSPDGKLIASGSIDKTLRLWNADTRLPAADPLPAHEPVVASVAFSPDGRRIASAGGTTIRLWDVASRTPVGEPIAGTHRSQSIGWCTAATGRASRPPATTRPSGCGMPTPDRQSESRWLGTRTLSPGLPSTQTVGASYRPR